MRTMTAILVMLSLVAPLLALDGDRAAYMGGTAAAYSDVKGPVEGRLTTAGDGLRLVPEAQSLRGVDLSIPYSQIVDLEYGQKAGRRIGLAIGLAVINPVGLATLFSKKRKHFLTIGYRDAAGVEQVAVLELGKDLVRTTLAVVETRSGKAITYQDDEARKAAR